MAKEKEISSFRDPLGSIFYLDKEVYRSISPEAESILEKLSSSGLHKGLVETGLMLDYEWVSECTIKPEQIRFISYPYEWCFGMLRDAALTTLEVCTQALSYNLTLKDASAYNIQYHKGKMKLIDHLSFTDYKEGAPWVAYKQFCQHFLAPLTLMSYKDLRLGKLLQEYINGVPLDLCSRLLPSSSFKNFGVLAHIHLHSSSQKKYGSRKVRVRGVSKKNLLALLDNLKSTIKSLGPKKGKDYWLKYEDLCNYSIEATDSKINVVQKFIKEVVPNLTWDLGCNLGAFSNLVSTGTSVAIDNDPYLIEKVYQKVKKESYGSNILPLTLDITNPSPGIGWANQERKALLERGPVDLVICLALIHHLCIGNNLPFSYLASFLGEICRWLIIEWVPKEDSQVQKMLATRENVFLWYNQEKFETELEQKFKTLEKVQVENSTRVLYFMRRK